MMRISQTIGVISGISGVFSFVNEGADFFQRVRSFISYLSSQRNGAHDQIPQDVLQLQSDLQVVLQLESDLQRLRDDLPAMYDLIDRAEWRSHENCVAELLPKLKDAVYDADDLLDEFRWCEQKMEVEGNVSQSPFFDFLNNVIQGSFNKVKDIQKRLNNLSNQLEKMRLREVTQRFDKSVRPETSSFPNEAKIFGRDKELKQVMGLLGVPTKRKRACSSANASARNQVSCTSGVPVLPIVGIGGVGKTTLAQHIGNHPQVKSHFDLIIWICVSDDFDVKRLTQEAIQSSCGKKAKTDHLDSLQRDLANNVKNKRFLLILDDMWDDSLKEDMQCWKRFCAPLTDGLQGSVMLLTTRSPEVADGVRTMEPISLEGLKDDVFWDFFKLCVFGSDCPNNNPELESIGRSILPKLKGSPLAAKTLGRLLRMQLHPTHWNNVLKSELWELKQKETDILPALRLSYIYLPFHLKRCFSFCAIYPKDHKFEKDSLSEIWVAEGFVEAQGDIPIQHIGCQYFEELVNRSFFQKIRGTYLIHDLLHDMAQLVSRHDCFILKDTSDFGKVPENVRHLSILSSTKVDRSNLLRLSKHRKIRTLLCDKPLRRTTLASVMDRWCSEFQCMRVFSCESTKELPDSIGHWKHLWYLKISRDCRFKSLPSAFCCLYNLQILHATKCKLESLPNDFGKLLNLQVFELSGFLYQSKGEQDLHIYRCQNLSILEQFLQHVPAIKRIRIEYCRRLVSLPTAGSCSHDTYQPPTNVLDNIDCSSLTSLYLSSPHLTSIRLQKWTLPALQKLNIEGCGSLTFIGESESVFTKLLRLGGSSSIKTFSSLTELSIDGCNKLSTLDGLLALEYIPAVEKICVDDCRELQSLPGERFGSFPFLKDLVIRGCPNLDWRSGLVLPSSLERLNLNDCGDISACFPSCLESLTSLVSLTMNSCAGVASIPRHLWTSNLASLQELTLWSCPGLGTSIGGAEAIPKVKDAHIWGCPNVRRGGI